MLEIATISLGAMDNGAHYAYHVETMNSVEADAKVKAKVAAQLTAYKAAIAKEDEALKISAKSFTTDQIAEADAQRDAMYMGLKQSVKGYQKMKDPSIQEAVKVLNQLFKDYGIATVSIRPRACFFPFFSFLPLFLHNHLNPLCVQY